MVYDASDAVSEALAREYVRAHGLSERQLVAVDLRREVIAHAGAVPDEMSPEQLSKLREMVGRRAQPDAQALLLTWSAPSRVQGACAMSITSAMTLGYDSGWCGGCSATRTSAYYDSDSARPFDDLGMRPTMMLGASTLDAGRALIARGTRSVGWSARLERVAPASSTSTQAAAVGAVGWLVRTDDQPRSVRWQDMQAACSAWAASGPGQNSEALDLQCLTRKDGSLSAAGSAGNLLAPARPVMFVLTGAAAVESVMAAAKAGQEPWAWAPGAVADHLTSFGGALPDALGQMPATAWIASGATGSYGTVEEPCNYQQKFPRASVLVRRYTQGETLIEAYWKSVQWPGQGLFIGDPLARPWAQ